MTLRGKKWTARTQLFWMWVLMVLALIGWLVCYVPFASLTAANDAHALYSGWKYKIGDAAEYSPVARPDPFIAASANQTLTMVHSLTEAVDAPTLMFKVQHRTVHMYVGDELIFTTDPETGPHTAIYFVPLPEDYLGKELRVESSSPYRIHAKSLGTVWIGSSQALAARAMSDTAPDIMNVILMEFSGLALMAFSLANMVRARGKSSAQWDNALFGLFCVIYGLSLLLTSLAFMVVHSPIGKTNLDLILTYLYPVPLLWFLWRKATNCKRLMLVTAIIWSLSVLATLAGTAVGLWRMPTTLDVINPIIICVTLVVVIVSVIETASGNRFYRNVFPALVLLAASGALASLGRFELYEIKEMLRVVGMIVLPLLVWMDVFRAYMSDSRADAEERQMMQMKSYLAAEQLEISAAHNQETRLLRHEFRHHVAALQMLQREGDMGAVGDYLSRLSNADEDFQPVQYCRHALVNAILAQHVAVGKKEDIAFAIEADVPETLSVMDQDLTSLLVNMLENAVEAARMCPKGERWIQVQVRKKERFLLVVCRNSRQDIRLEPKDSGFSSTKSAEQYHGYGIMAMRQVAARYHSKLNISYDEKTFSVKTLLRLQ